MMRLSVLCWLLLLGFPLLAQIIEPLERIPANRTVRIGPGGIYRFSFDVNGEKVGIYVNGELKHRSEKIYREPYRTSTDPVEVRFSNDGKHYAYIFFRAGHDVLVLDSKEIPGDTPYETFHLSPLGRHYWFTTGEALVVDGMRYPNVKREITVAFNARETEWAAVVDSPKEGYELLRNGKSCADGWYFSNVTFLPDGRLCWTQVQDHMDEQLRRRELFLDGKPVATFSVLEKLEYIKGTPDGKHLAISVTMGRPGEQSQSYLILDGKKSEVYEGYIGRMDLREDGICLAVVSLQTDKKSESRVIFNGKAGERFLNVPWSPSISPSGKHYAYFAVKTKGEFFLITDNQPAQPLPFGLFALRIDWDKDEHPLLIYGLDGGKTAMVGDRVFGPFAPRAGVEWTCLTPTGHVLFPAGEIRDGKVVRALYLDGKPITGTEFDIIYDYQVHDEQYVLLAGKKDGDHLQLFRILLPVE